MQRNHSDRCFYGGDERELSDPSAVRRRREGRPSSEVDVSARFRTFRPKAHQSRAAERFQAGGSRGGARGARFRTGEAPVPRQIIVVEGASLSRSVAALREDGASQKPRWFPRSTPPCHECHRTRRDSKRSRGLSAPLTSQHSESLTGRRISAARGSARAATWQRRSSSARPPTSSA
jgi:hypothetical protein